MPREDQRQTRSRPPGPPLLFAKCTGKMERLLRIPESEEGQHVATPASLHRGFLSSIRRVCKAHTAGETRPVRAAHPHASRPHHCTNRRCMPARYTGPLAPPTPAALAVSCCTQTATTPPEELAATAALPQELAPPPGCACSSSDIPSASELSFAPGSTVSHSKEASSWA